MFGAAEVKNVTCYGRSNYDRVLIGALPDKRDQAQALEPGTLGDNSVEQKTNYGRTTSLQRRVAVRGHG